MCYGKHACANHRGIDHQSFDVAVEQVGQTEHSTACE